MYAKIPQDRARHLRGARYLAAAALALGTATAGLSTAQAAAAPAESDRNTEHCYVVLEKLEPGQETSTVKSKECVGPGEQRTSAAGTLLMTWYQHANYKGAVTHIEGDDGKCDSSGYGIRATNYFWRESLSSYRVWNDCWYSKLWSDVNYGGTPSGTNFGDQHYLGVHNDNVASLQINKSGQF